MKKTITIVILAALLIACAANVAYAETAEEKISAIAVDHDKVIKAECAIYERTCLIAIKTEKFATRSEYEEYTAKVCEQIKTDCEIDNVLITRNPKIMFKLEQLNKLDETERGKTIKEIIERELNRCDHKHPKPEPRMLGN